MAFCCDEWLSPNEVLKTLAAIHLRQVSEPHKTALTGFLSSKTNFYVCWIGQEKKAVSVLSDFLFFQNPEIVRPPHVGVLISELCSQGQGSNKETSCSEVFVKLLFSQ